MSNTVLIAQDVLGEEQRISFSNPLNVIMKSRGFSAKVDVTRPTNTNTYDVGDCVGATAAAITFPSVAMSGGGEYLVTAVSLRFDLTAVPSGMTSFVLHLYSATPPSDPADEATWALTAPDAAVYLGAVAIPTPVDLGAVLYIETSGLTKQVKLTGTSMYGLLVADGAWIAASAGTHTITVCTKII